MLIVGIVGTVLLLLALNVLVSVIQEKGPLSWRLKGGAVALVSAIVVLDVAVWLGHA